VASMALVQRLAHTTPTALMLEYLRSQWAEAARRGLGPGVSTTPPVGPEAIALMRLITQAQTEAEQRTVHSAWGHLPPSDRELLAREMSLSGVQGEAYALTPDNTEGPAFLVYYSPVFIRVAAHSDMSGLAALKMLAEVYRAGRQLWAQSADDAGRTCTIHIGEMKAVGVNEIVEGHGRGCCWLMEKTSDSEAVVCKCELSTFRSNAEKIVNGRAVVLRFWASRYTELALESSTLPITSAGRAKSTPG